ncbi:hypothetical protein MCNF_09610 [Mycolicibacterium confluentis]|uniref:Uncharacterized protein n=2 Tax=Mycolicibacterium confluentis TaxID=28047 RepID=A0A7I7XSX4_9MYCO|nr:hypothetical protein MCNF_09610 [Mycolicibacterium confluentis]
MPIATWPRILRDMAGKEIDRARAQSALAVVRQHPGMALFVVSPAILAVGAVWWLAGTGWAVLLLIALVAAGGAALLLKR